MTTMNLPRLTSGARAHGAAHQIGKLTKLWWTKIVIAKSHLLQICADNSSRAYQSKPLSKWRTNGTIERDSRLWCFPANECLLCSGELVDLYLPRKCSASNRLITAKDHASVQLSVAKVRLPASIPTKLGKGSC
jgi:hypothetical protein